MNDITEEIERAMDRLREALETHTAVCKHGTPAESERSRAEVEAARKALHEVLEMAEQSHAIG